MSIKTINQMPFVKSEDVKPLYDSDEIVEKLAQAVNGMREMGLDADQKQRFDLELIYSLAVALKEKLKNE